MDGSFVLGFGSLNSLAVRDKPDHCYRYRRYTAARHETQLAWVQHRDEGSDVTLAMKDLLSCDN